MSAVEYSACINNQTKNNVDHDAAVLPDATATSRVSNVDASPNHMIELSPKKKKN